MSVRLRLIAPLLLLAIAGCASASSSGDAAGAPTPGLARGPRNLSFDPTPTYRQIGMIAQGLPFPLVGRVGYVAAATPDTTHAVIAFSFALNSLSFVREADDRFRANYTVGITIDRDGQRVRVVDATEAVLVNSFRETSRTDESVLFQEVIDLAPGEYTMSVAVRDRGSQRSAQEQRTITVPRFGDEGVSTPIPVNEATPRAARSALPDFLMAPRATVAFGRDSVLFIYAERYGPGDNTVQLLVRNEGGELIWTETASVEPRSGLAAGVIEIPVGRLGIGVAQVAVATPGGRDTASTYVFVGFGDDLPVVRFEEMLSYLRFYATTVRIRALRDAPIAERATAWATFLRETDRDPSTPGNESLREYFDRMVRANTRFLEEDFPGWLSDRGKVLIVLGEPTQVVEPPGSAFQRGRQQLWEYREGGLQLVFYDETGTGRWQLTQSSEARFEQEFRRRLR